MADLRDLGLSEYEERAYRALLDVGATTAKQLSSDSGVPMGRIYDVLNDLEAHDLVRSQSASRPKKYAPVDPSTALDRLLSEKTQELETRKQQYESIVEDLRGELDAAEPAEMFWTAAVGSQETADLLVERLGTADRSIIMVLSTQTSQLLDIDRRGEEILDALVAAIERGVAVRLLMRRDLVPELPPEIGVRYRESLATHARFDVRTAPQLSGTFTLIDSIETVVEVPHPLDRAETFGVIDLTDQEFAASVSEAFEPRWDDAEPLVL